MTIKQFAEEQGISSQAVYQRLKKNHVRTETLTEKGSGELTGDGEAVLRKLFTDENRTNKPIKDDLIESLKEQLAELRIDNARKEEKVETLKERLRDLESDRDTWRKLYENEQEKTMLALKALPAPAERPAEGKPSGSTRLSWRERLTGKRKTGIA